MPSTFAGAVIPAGADTVWRVLRNFGALADWQPAVTSSTLRDGDVPGLVGSARTLTSAEGGTVVESLVALDDVARSLTYEMTGDVFPVYDYRATIQVWPVTSTDEAFVGWSADFACDPAAEQHLIALFRDTIFTGGLNALAKYLA
ncbi:SRPBCC family protein [Streptomyces sp. NPDC049936]|uniref:SRPBCC family protein n=1 Tax=Streptomyces sp. NPDC049936 TaxID=3365599 RepID=UPI00379716A0